VQVAKSLHISFEEWTTADEVKREAIWLSFEWLIERENEQKEGG